MVHFLHVSYAVHCERERSNATGSIYNSPIAVPISDWRIVIELPL